ncbi:D-2-hydroxyacid dehydrogenase [Paratissierella segnis]|uniref:D-2-hydroxyacid dehydrogenase n=1 Tax=Paratissierella segnis TaxID=2763679 RepID=A0A926EV01_9FIRM|nr:D-2-hydroxyacid dehydrogenase [Paratissierella segnis]MBC8588017.1 D-2-hydroxyacid dehydrogenase [Paratissierella segnis]
MFRILVTDGMEKGAVQKLRDLDYEVVEKFYELDELKEKVKEFDCLVVRSATKVRKDIIDEALKTNRLKLIIRGGVGIDNIDKDYAEANGIKVRNTPNASSVSVAELTMGHMINIARFSFISNYTMRLGEWNKKQYKGVELSGKTLGLIGMGRIAKEVAARAGAFGMNVIYTNRSGPKMQIPYKYVSFDELLGNSDFISLHIPSTSDGKYLLSKDEFSKMKDGVYIINTARGKLIDEAALLEALDSGKVAAAGLDVFETEPVKNEKLYTHERISLTPHIAGSTKEAQEKIGEEIVEIIKKTL